MSDKRPTGVNYTLDSPWARRAAQDQRLEITALLNDATVSRKVVRALLRDKYKLSEQSIEELCPLWEVVCG